MGGLKLPARIPEAPVDVQIEGERVAVRGLRRSEAVGRQLLERKGWCLTPSEDAARPAGSG